ncbi:MAG: sodium-translocating pyrophosphatase [Candidatus Hydrothermia bacterium]|jgi:K(+)-stimulated pyrophosphate-energized sodium pump|nr:sodium-translocating pyrophosphatase [Candidatus Hydrothermia bacterium]
MNLVIFSLVSAIISFVVAIIYSYMVRRKEAGTDEMVSISLYIREGARAFLKREYRTIAILSLIVILIIAFGLSYEGISYVIYTIIAFVFGAFFSLLAGWIGMDTATISNVRTTNAAKNKGLIEAFKIAYLGGSVMGLSVASLSILGMSGLFFLFYLISKDIQLSASVVAGFSMGAAFVALFARVGGGIYTKAADVGADLVGKVEAGIPEDDPRNPAVIADNVGDNVGDTAGMGADLYDSLVAGTVSAIVIAAFAKNADPMLGIGYALALGAIGTLVSIFGYFFIGFLKNLKPERILLSTVFIVGSLFSIFSLILTKVLFGNLTLFWPLVFGLVSGILIGYIAEFFSTGKRIVELAEAANSGVAVNIIEGIALGMRSAVIPGIAVAISFVIAFKMGEASGYGGFYGVAIACIGMLAITGITVTVDAFGPIADNAGGIAEMSGLGKEVRSITDVLDAAGNTTAAIGKGFAIGSAIFTVMAVFSAFSDMITQRFGLAFNPSLMKPEVVAAALIGAIIPFFFSSGAMRAVGRTAKIVVEEVRRQWREIPGLLEGKVGVKADYARIVDITTEGAIKNMTVPGMIAFLSPIIVGILFGLEALGGFLVGAMVAGIPLALTMNNAGAAWDNAKKFIEQSGAFGGKGSQAHKASVEGDTVGDPFKDTAGPSLNILLKMMSIVSLVFLPFIYQFHNVLINTLKFIFGG